MPNRLHNWEERLDGFLLESLRRSIPGVVDPLVWHWDPQKGKNCGTWTFDAIEQIIGFNIYNELMSHVPFSDAKGAQNVIKVVFDLDTYEAMWDHLFDTIPLVRVQKGDVALVPAHEESSRVYGFHYASGIVSAPYVYVMQPGGVERLPLKDIVKCYSVGSYVIPQSQEGNVR